ncbi:MAG: MarR family winged helix-turn-helix transcriptional regulator [Methylocystaceae bacterium]
MSTISRTFTSFVCFNLRIAMKKMDRVLGSLLEEFNITAPQSFVLFCLLEEDGMTLKEVGTKAMIDSSSMTVLVDKLESENLVQRRLDPDDRRAIRVFLTKEGKNLAERALETGHQFNNYVLGFIPAEDQEAFMEGLEAVVRNVE